MLYDITFAHRFWRSKTLYDVTFARRFWRGKQMIVCEQTRLRAFVLVGCFTEVCL